MDDLFTYLKNLNEEEVKNFTKTTKAKINAKTKVHRVVSDTSWVTMVEDSIPYLDNIIRNPRRFIVQEENIVPIEKAKVVTEESIRHLAQNTNLIQDVKEDGTVIPLKLLNVYREETVDLYENRFIKSLVDNLYQFVNNKLKESDQKSRVDVENKVSYEAENKSENGQINVSLNLESKNSEIIEEEKKDGHDLETRIEHIKDVLAAFMGSQFIKGLQASQPVRSPIRKTNVILKEPNFIKALELWEYLESNAIKPITTITDEELDRSQEVKDKYDFTFYLQNMALNLNKNTKYDKVNVIEDLTIEEALKKLILEKDMNKKEVKAFIDKEMKKVLVIKKAQEDKVRKHFVNFLREYNRKKKKALELLK